MPPALTSKRSACDRCRIQKLRCPRSADGIDACARCTRLDARCITSYPRPSNGTSNSLSHSHMQPELRPRSLALPSPAATVTTASRPASMTTITASEQMQSLPPDRRPSAVASDTSPYDSLTYSMLEDNVDYFTSHTTALPFDNLGSLDRADQDTISSLLCQDSRPFSISIPALGGGAGDGDSSSMFCSDAAKEIQHQSSDTFSNDQPYNILEHNPRLSSLNLDLSRRLEQCLLVNVPEDRSMVDDAHPETPRTVDGGIAGREGSSSSCLLENALGDLSEFIVIIQSYTKKTGQTPSARDSNGQSFASGPNRRISIIVFLNLISAYLQIVVIYDKLFRSLSARLFATSEGSAYGQRALPGLRLAGLSVGPGSLQTKILIHAILHQFDLVERMLGLPADLRVTDKSGFYSGLCEDDRAMALLGAVSNGNKIENGWVQMHVEDHRPSNALSSLRATIKMVQAFLDI